VMFKLPFKNMQTNVGEVRKKLVVTRRYECVRI
jgi:hypothetical protein